jgi:hypothetical protein
VRFRRLQTEKQSDFFKIAFPNDRTAQPTDSPLIAVIVARDLTVSARRRSLDRINLLP